MHFAEFAASCKSKPYERQKDSSEIQLSSFSHNFFCLRRVSTATTVDIIKFLISKDAVGKWSIHMSSCSMRTCDCPTSLAVGTVDSYIGKQKAIFDKLGRTGLSNPLAHPTIKEYTKFVRKEQAQKPTQLHQAVPFFYNKFIHLVVYLQGLNHR